MEETPNSTPGERKKFPWKPVLATLGAVGGAHALGYMSAGTLARVLGNTSLGEKFRALPRDKQKQYLSNALKAVTAAGLGAVALREMARDKYIHDATSKEKTASVSLVDYAYARALEARR
jgi:hypothetical protein